MSQNPLANEINNTSPEIRNFIYLRFSSFGVMTCAALSLQHPLRAHTFCTNTSFNPKKIIVEKKKSDFGRKFQF